MIKSKLLGIALLSHYCNASIIDEYNLCILRTEVGSASSGTLAVIDDGFRIDSLFDVNANKFLFKKKFIDGSLVEWAQDDVLSINPLKDYLTVNDASGNNKIFTIDNNKVVKRNGVNENVEFEYIDHVTVLRYKNSSTVYWVDSSVYTNDGLTTYDMNGKVQYSCTLDNDACDCNSIKYVRHPENNTISVTVNNADVAKYYYTLTSSSSVESTSSSSSESIGQSSQSTSILNKDAVFNKSMLSKFFDLIGRSATKTNY